ncbi:SusD/RagB family nutrient-binding outer membrane lipoprotein [Portibacter marinus]|uniref:SusD/RagB family nutrient-binding outer membrane lipoprotein n=1 Tax=Portibacter marinus TaxID=2898660 RepID=UPI001F362F20|nr:SusD/RagB family nutrient-binding outer membrane lipoprotein [Portibacter marinus]
MLIFLPGCDDGFDELNINPTQAPDLDPAFQLTFVQIASSNNRYEYWRAQYIYCSTIIQHNASSFSYWAGDKYNEIDSYSSAMWDSSYPRDLKNVVDLVNRTAEDPAQANFNAAARIVKVYLFGRITDLYGDIPYSEAGKGFIDEIFFPKYDTQESIYNDFFSELDAAVAQFSDSALPLQGDIWLDNDISKWKKWANSLKLRYGMRLTKVNPSLAESMVKQALQAGVMESIDDAPVVYHTEMDRNGNTAVMQADDNFRLSEAFVSYLQSTNDPRLSVWGMTYDTEGNEQPDVSTWKGLPNGTDGNSPEFEILEQFVRHNRSTIKSVTAPYIHQGLAEVRFLQAEAAIRGWDSGSAADYFADGLRAGIQQANLYDNTSISEEETEAFVAGNPLDESSTDAALEHIGTEQWVSTYLDAMEAFANWRRTGYPVLTPVDHEIGQTGGTIPRRLYYPPSELGVNPNFKEAIDRQFNGTNDLTGRVWWDAQ